MTNSLENRMLSLQEAPHIRLSAI